MSEQNVVSKAEPTEKQEIKVLEYTPDEKEYQFGEGENALTLYIGTVDTFYDDVNEHCKVTKKPAKRLQVVLSSNGIDLFVFNKKDHVDAPSYNSPKNEDLRRSLRYEDQKVDNKRMLAEMLCNDESKAATAVRMFFSKIKGNPLVDEINKLIEETRMHPKEKEPQSSQSQTSSVEIARRNAQIKANQALRNFVRR